jgi:hypothetical protein
MWLKKGCFAGDDDVPDLLHPEDDNYNVCYQKNPDQLIPNS